MKSIKTILMTAMLFAVFTLVNEFLLADTAAFTSYRVRTVPSSTEQKKKEPATETKPQVEIKQASIQSSVSCSQTDAIKTRLAVSNGGAPK